MTFRLEALRAGQGDALLLHWGDPPRFAIVDGGPKGTYAASLRPRLEALRATAGLADDEALVAELMMVSHIDEDHIVGLIDLTKAMLARQDDGSPPQLRILRLWHNAFEDLVGAPPAVDAAELAALAAQAPDPGVRAAAMVVASVAQGATLRDNARRLGIPINSPVGGLIQAPAPGHDPKVVDFDGGLRLTIVAPDATRVAALQKEWERKRKADHHIASLVTSGRVVPDTSLTNLSSVVVLAEHEDRRMLLTGDALGTLTLAGLEAAGLVEPGGVLELDVLKVAHHGSIRNNSADGFRRLKAKHYVFSADGTDDNPDVATLDALLEGRDDDAFTAHFTYAANVDHLRERIEAAGRTVKVEVAPVPPAPQPWLSIDVS